MPKIAMTTENKAPSFEAYPPLKYKTGEKGRICIIDKEPSVIYVHEHRMPVVVNGEVQKEQKTGKRGPYEVDKTEYAGKYACSGDFNVVAKERTDPANCEQCEWAIKHPAMFSEPKRRFGMHVLKYKTAPGSSSIVLPFSFDLVLYQFTDYRFDGLVEMAKEHGNLRERDLTVNCVSGDFNNFEFQIGGTCEWMADETRQQQVKEAFTNQKAEDVDALLARKASKTDLAMVYDKVAGRHSLIGKTDTGEGFSDLGLGGASMDDVFGSSKTEDAPDWAKSEPAEAATAPAEDKPSSGWGEGISLAEGSAEPAAADEKPKDETEGSGFADLDSFLSDFKS